MEYKNKVSAVKIFKGVAKANVNFWGGDRVPIIQSALKFDWKKFQEAISVPPNAAQKINQCATVVNNSREALFKLEHEKNQLKSVYVFMIHNLIHRSTMISASTGGPYLTTNISYQVTDGLLRRLDLSSSVPQTIFYTFKSSGIPNNMQSVKRDYEESIRKTKDAERKMLLLLTKINSESNKLKAATKEMAKVAKNR